MAKIFWSGEVVHPRTISPEPEYTEQFNKGKRRKVGSEYQRLNNKKTRLAKKLASVTDECLRVAIVKEIKETLARTYETPCIEPMDENYRRIKYVRYADDFLIGVIGTKAECQKIKADIYNYMTDKLGLDLSDEKTLITNAKDKAKFLGYEIFVRSKAFKHRDKRGVIRRFGNGSVILHVNMEVAKLKLMEYGAMRIVQEGGHDIWKPKPRAFMIGNHVENIVAQYNTEIRGFYNYYSIANNISTIGSSFGYIMEYSMYKTIAQKLNLSMSQAKLKYLKDKKFVVPFKDKMGEIKYRVFYDGDFKRKTPFMDSIVDNIPNTVYVPKLSLIERLKSGMCELCGTKDELVMHHVRNLNLLKDDTAWNAIMLKKHRKTIAICKACNQQIQNNERKIEQTQ